MAPSWFNIGFMSEEPSTSPIIYLYKPSRTSATVGKSTSHGAEVENRLGSLHGYAAEFVHFVVEDVNTKREITRHAASSSSLKKSLVEANQETRNLIGLGFFETLQNFASWRSGGNKSI